MKKLFLAFLLMPFYSIAQVDIDWAVCVNEKKYQYTTPNQDGFKIINKPFQFCYNFKYFSVMDKTGYNQIFPLERRNFIKNTKGEVVEEFTNGNCQNFSMGDVIVRITYSKPQSILISFTKQITAHCYYIETNQLPLQKNDKK